MRPVEVVDGSNREMVPDQGPFPCWTHPQPQVGACEGHIWMYSKCWGLILVGGTR